MEIKREKVVPALNYLLNYRITSVDEPRYKSSEDEDLTLIDQLNDEDDESSIFVEEFIATLPSREQIKWQEFHRWISEKTLECRRYKFHVCKGK